MTVNVWISQSRMLSYRSADFYCENGGINSRFPLVNLIIIANDFPFVISGARLA